MDYLIDPTLSNINKLFVLSFKNSNGDPRGVSFERCYMLLVEIKDFIALVHNKPFFDQQVINRQEGYEKFIEMSKFDNYTTGNLLYYLHHQNYYKLIGIDLSRQTNTNIPQQINIAGKLEEDDGATMFFLLKNRKNTILNFSLN